MIDLYLYEHTVITCWSSAVPMRIDSNRRIVYLTAFSTGKEHGDGIAVNLSADVAAILPYPF